MKCRKLLAAILAVTMIGGMSIPALAEDASALEGSSTAENAASQEEMLPEEDTASVAPVSEGEAPESLSGIDDLPGDRISEGDGFTGEDAAQPERYAGGAYFTDVPNGQWYTQAVNYLAEKKIVSGLPDGSFRPGARVTRGEFVKMLASLSGKDISARRDRNGFSDVSSEAWYTKFIRWGVKEKIISGVGNRRFNPSGAITRQELAVVLWRFNKNAMGRTFPRYQQTNFRDGNKISSWASVEVSSVEGAGLLRGYEDRSFRPKGYATRAETAQVLYKYHLSMGSYERASSLDDLRYIMHGGGQISYCTTSNSLEALNESYRNGHRIIEIDLSWTTDNQLALVHSWGGSYPNRTAMDQFLSGKIMGWLTPLSLDGLASWMRKHPDVRIIPDVKVKNTVALETISRNYPDLVTRFMPYIYHTWEYDKVADMGYRSIFMILYQMSASEKANVSGMVNFARSKNLAGIAINPNTDSAYYVAGKSGIPVLPFVVDDMDLMYDFSRKGADGFFTDRQNMRIEW